MSIQFFIDHASSIEIDRRKQVGISFSRNQVARTAVRSETQPWRFNIEFNQGYQWSALRDPWEKISDIDRVTPEWVQLSKNPGMSYIMQYRGDFPKQINTPIITGLISPKILNLNVANVPSKSGAYLFRRGDFIQPNGHNYTYTVTEDVLRGTSLTVPVPIHRPVLFQTGYTVVGKGLTVGTVCSFRVIIVELPTIRLIGTRRAELTGTLGLMEYITL